MPTPTPLMLHLLVVHVGPVRERASVVVRPVSVVLSGLPRVHLSVVVDGLFDCLGFAVGHVCLPLKPI